MSEIICHPIIFSTEMVEAILNGIKNQTRRVVTAQRSYFNGDSVPMESWATLDWGTAWIDGGPSPAGNPGPYLKAHWLFDGNERLMARIYPRVQPGDRLWVRETWWWNGQDRQTLLYKAAGPGDLRRLKESFRYELPEHVRRVGGKWKSSLHMPRWACRLYLDVVRVRIQRIQEISEQDCRAEGAPLARIQNARDPSMGPIRDGFANLWDGINAKKGHGWELNPWVYVYDFKLPERCQRCDEPMVLKQNALGEGAMATMIECPSCGMQRTVKR